MILLKTTTMLIGLMSPSSASIDHTVVPSMTECKSYLVMEEKRQRATGQDVKIQRTDTKLSVELNIMGHTANASFECIDVK